jgi:hemoglobin
MILHEPRASARSINNHMKKEMLAVRACSKTGSCRREEADFPADSRAASPPRVGGCGYRVRRRASAAFRLFTALLFAACAASFTGCFGSKPKAQQRDFFTSGSNEADQRASQRMAKEEQLTGKEKGSKKATPSGEGAAATGGTNKAAQVESKLTLFERLGGQDGIVAIVDDFTQRVLQDPRVNWQRNGVQHGGFSIHRGKSVTWHDSPENVALLKKHLAQFVVLATGGPAHYNGKEIKSTHAGMHIGNPEFDAALGDLKASLDKLKIPNKEQKELLSIIETTRPLIVVER